MSQGSSSFHWMTAGVLCAGAFLTSGVRPQLSLDLRRPLDEVVSPKILGFQGRDHAVSQGEARVAGFSDYLLRTYADPSDPTRHFSIYVGYYATQTQGRTIHSPKNCLPGSGWQALSASSALVPLAQGQPATVNRYLLRRENEYALVLYWYQGRGRIAHNEYLVKWDLLRDSAVRRRSDEALVRVVVPVVTSEEEAFELARSVASGLIPAVAAALPAKT